MGGCWSYLRSPSENARRHPDVALQPLPYPINASQDERPDQRQARTAGRQTLSDARTWYGEQPHAQPVVTQSQRRTHLIGGRGGRIVHQSGHDNRGPPRSPIGKIYDKAKTGVMDAASRVSR